LQEAVLEETYAYLLNRRVEDLWGRLLDEVICDDVTDLVEGVLNEHTAVVTTDCLIGKWLLFVDELGMGKNDYAL